MQNIGSVVATSRFNVAKLKVSRYLERFVSLTQAAEIHPIHWDGNNETLQGILAPLSPSIKPNEEHPETRGFAGHHFWCASPTSDAVGGSWWFLWDSAMKKGGRWWKDLRDRGILFTFFTQCAVVFSRRNPEVLCHAIRGGSCCKLHMLVCQGAKLSTGWGRGQLEDAGSCSMYPGFGYGGIPHDASLRSRGGWGCCLEHAAVSFPCLLYATILGVSINAWNSMIKG